MQLYYTRKEREKKKFPELILLHKFFKREIYYDIAIISCLKNIYIHNINVISILSSLHTFLFHQQTALNLNCFRQTFNYTTTALPHPPINQPSRTFVIYHPSLKISPSLHTHNRCLYTATPINRTHAPKIETASPFYAWASRLYLYFVTTICIRESERVLLCPGYLNFGSSYTYFRRQLLLVREKVIHPRESLCLLHACV